MKSTYIFLLFAVVETESKMVVICKVKQPHLPYYTYYRPDFCKENCTQIFVGVDSLFDDFVATLAGMNTDVNLVCLMFLDNTSPGDMVSSLEAYLRGIQHLDIKMLLDIGNLYKQHGEAECMNVINIALEVLLSNENLKVAFSPIIITPAEMSRLSEFCRIQTQINQSNIDRHLNPVFPFRWTMRQTGGGELVHCSSNWNAAGSTLSERGSHKYFSACYRYLFITIDAELTENHNLTSRIAVPAALPAVPEAPEVVPAVPAAGPAAPAPGRGRGGRGRGLARGRGGHRGRVVRGGRHCHCRCHHGGPRGVQRRGRTARRGRGRSSDDDFALLDGRVGIARRKITREMDKLKALRALVVKNITKEKIEEFFDAFGKK